MFVVNSLHMKEHPTFVHFANSLGFVRQHKATRAAPRPAGLHGAPCGRGRVAPLENGQNYLYYDVLYGGYPLIHNSTLIGDAGYYYPDFDSAAGGRALLEAWLHHDERLDDYRAKAGGLQSVSIDNPANLARVRRVWSPEPGSHVGQSSASRVGLARPADPAAAARRRSSRKP